MKIIQFLCISIMLFLGSNSFAQTEKSASDSKKAKSENVSNVLEVAPKKKFEPINEMPRFPGCENQDISVKEKENCAKGKMLMYVFKNLKYPKAARKEKIEGMAVVEFIVSSTGKIKDLKVVRDPGGGCGQAALDVMLKMQEEKIWIPGNGNNKPVDVQYILPIKFKL